MLAHCKDQVPQTDQPVTYSSHACVVSGALIGVREICSLGSQIHTRTRAHTRARTYMYTFYTHTQVDQQPFIERLLLKAQHCLCCEGHELFTGFSNLVGEIKKSPQAAG